MDPIVPVPGHCLPSTFRYTFRFYNRNFKSLFIYFRLLNMPFKNLEDRIFRGETQLIVLNQHILKQIPNAWNMRMVHITFLLLNNNMVPQ